VGFDLTAFSRASLDPRRVTVKTPDLKDWFSEGAEPAFEVRGLTGEEFYTVRQATAKRQDLQAIASRLLSGDGQAIADAIEEFYGSVPEEYARRVEILIHGCLEPTLDRAAAMKLFKYFPSAAHTIADAILRATGEGSVAGESSGRGETPAPATTST
jgi:hypothetical protein